LCHFAGADAADTLLQGTESIEGGDEAGIRRANAWGPAGRRGADQGPERGGAQSKRGRVMVATSAGRGVKRVIVMAVMVAGVEWSDDGSSPIRGGPVGVAWVARVPGFAPLAMFCGPLSLLPDCLPATLGKCLLL